MRDTPVREVSSELSEAEAEELATRAGIVFQPCTPIAAGEFFAGRWEQIAAVHNSLNQAGLHTVILGERGVGKTSLVNMIGQLPCVMEDAVIENRHGARLVVKVHTHNGDSFSDVWDVPLMKCIGTKTSR